MPKITSVHGKNITLLILTCCVYTAAQADDSTIGYVDGSLVFTKDNDIGLEQESLAISSSKISISYTFYNHSDHTITKTVAFPFPAKPYNGSTPTGERPCFDKYVEKTPNKDCPFLDFTATVNGKKVTNYTVHYLATDKNGRDITKTLNKNKIPLSSYFVTGVKDYDGTYGGGEMDKDPVLKAKLKKLNITPDWSTQILLSWQETFPPKTKVIVNESYTPSTSKALLSHCDKKYCFKPYPAMRYEKACHSSSNSIEDVKTVQYVLKTGANWKNGVIGHLHLEFIPSSTEIVGFCHSDAMQYKNGKYVGDFKNYVPINDLIVSFLQVKPFQ